MQQEPATKTKTPTPHGTPYKTDVYEQFILWFAMPPMQQEKIGIETQVAFSQHFGIEITTTTRWKNRPDFKDRVRALRQEWGFAKTGGVIQGIYLSALKGNSDSQRIWLQYFDGWSEKQTIEHTNKVEIGVGDIRFLIEQLPEPLKSKHYGNLRELLDDASAFRNSRGAESGDWSTRPALPIPREAHHNAPDVSGETADVVPSRYQRGIRRDMEREASSYNYQSAAWRRKE